MTEEKAGIIEVIEGMAQRLEKARTLAKDGKVKKIEGAEAFVVENEDGSKLYLVRDGNCTCPDFQQRKELHKGWCKHRLAIALTNQDRKERK